MGGRPSRSRFQDSNLGVGNDPINDEEEIDSDRIQAASDWSEVYRCKTGSWVSGISSRFFFDPDVTYFVDGYSSDFTIKRIRPILRAPYMQPHSTEYYQFEIPIPEIRLRMLKSQKLRIRKIIVEKITDCCGHFQLTSVPTWYVIGYRDNLAVVQFTDMRTSNIQCFVVDVRSGHILSTFEENFKHLLHRLYEAFLSPDKSLYLLRPNQMFNYRGYGDQYTASRYDSLDVRVVNVTTKMSQVTHLINVTHTSEYWCSIAFDPRYKWSRIAFGDYTSQHFYSCLVVYDLKTESVLHQKKDYIGGSRHISFSPGGLYLASLSRGLIGDNTEVHLYDPDTLDSLHCIVRNDKKHCFDFIIPRCTPLFCCSGHYMALASLNRESVSVYKLPIEQSLKSRCRVVLRKSVREEDITLLPLPTYLKTYLQFVPLYG